MGDCASRGVQEDPESKQIIRKQVAVQEMAFQEIKTKRQRGKKAMTEDEVYQLICEYFDSFDTDHDDALSFQEIIKMLKQIETNINKKRKHKIEIDMTEAKAFFAKIDINGDQSINKEEFYRFYKSL